MSLSIRNVLSNKKGVAEALGITLVGLLLLSAAGVVVANYAIVSKQSSQLQSLTQEVTNRAEVYASALNANLVTVPVPDMSRKCSTTPAMCTTITAVDTATTGKRILTIKADGVGGIAQTITRYPTLLSQTVTHVTAIDAQGNKTWALSGEGLHYDVWGLAVGVPSVVKPADMAGPTAGTSWVSVADRAGIDSAGNLWVWGKNDIGQAGIGSISAAPVVPKKITGTTSFRSVVTGDDRGYAIDSAGAPWVWGKNDKGQLGLGTTTNVMTPTKIAGSRMMTMAIGKDNIFGITMDGRLATAGATQAGFPPNSPPNWQVLNPGTQYKAIAASTSGALAMIENTGRLTMAGQAYTFTPMAGGVFTSVSLGATGGYAIGGSGNLYSWGTGVNGQLGQGATTSATTPTQVMSGTRFSEVSGGKTSAFAVDVSGNLYYFGKTPSGVVGSPDLPVVNVPTALLSESNFRGIASNNTDTSVALLDTAGNVYGMGTVGSGLWPMTYSGANNQPIRMPVPAGFSSNTW